MEEYYFKTAGWNHQDCVEKCLVKNDGMRIGSVACRKCEFCKGSKEPCEFTGNVDWIKCSLLDEAIGKTE